MDDKRVKCKYCNNEYWKVNLQDHEKECSKNPENKFIKLFSHKITKKQYWFGVLVLTIIVTFFRFLGLSSEATGFEMGEIFGSTAITILAIFGGLYLGLTRKKD
jgi:hypothetical protein